MLDIFQRLVRRNPRRSEADIQADVRQFILSAPFELEAGDLTDVTLESPVGDRRRIDVEAGCAVIEVKRDLRRDRTKKEAEEQLAGYVDFRMRETGEVLKESQFFRIRHVHFCENEIFAQMEVGNHFSIFRPF